MPAIRRPFEALLRSLREEPVAPGAAEISAAHGDLAAAHSLLTVDIGAAYRRILSAEESIAQAKQAITLQHGAEVIAALARSDDDAVPAGFDCAVTAHPAGGYALLWAADRSLTGKYATPQEASREARLNGYRCYDRREPLVVLLPH